AKIARIQRLSAYRVAPDSSITALRAGQALHAISRAGPPSPLLKWEKAPAISIASPAPAMGKDPFAQSDGGWTAAAFRQAPLGFNREQRAFLDSLANNAAIGEFQILARASSRE